MAAYQHEVDDAASRRDLGRDAIQQANEGRSQIVSQVKVVMNNPQTNLDTLAYSFSAVHYAMLVRQTIANVVEDGPLGAAGLHAQIKEAAALLHDPLAIGPALDTVMSNRIFNDITQTGAYDDPADGPLGELGRLVFRLPHKTLH
ncbi:hypothetical protein GV827_22370 [Sulfitobacter sp. JBTF-M27]|uniref:Uncharacterized protein n=1 Tax=Sulfitobacter sediminilitoris TaxID=2698830 RepID=A0A6P0CJE9_9RHOB|nr:hypothetical protein [Sulfitobacter sediminilitoris]NEK25115.1 hypothetical protein [Sulfitobacter sediminilitoris]